MKTIYNVAVKVHSQEQCDNLKKLCVNINLPYNEPFHFDDRGKNDDNYLIYNKSFDHLRAAFEINSNYLKLKEINELDFFLLLKKNKLKPPYYKTVEEFLNKIKI